MTSTNKTVLITGASSGIGKSLAINYAKDGWQVYACGRNQQRLDELTELHSNIKILAFDVTNIEAIKQATSDITSFDLLVLNAGNCEYIDNAKAFDSSLFSRVISANLLSAGYCLDALLPKLVSGGHLAFISSSATFLPLPRAEAYGASKAGLNYLAETLAVDLKPNNIDVSVVYPGFVKTPLTDKNDFAMPCRINPEDAATRIKKGLDKRQAKIHFPKRFTYFLKLFSLLPSKWWQAIAVKQIANQQTSRSA